jgi:hypothetical protein
MYIIMFCCFRKIKQQVIEPSDNFRESFDVDMLHPVYVSELSTNTRQSHSRSTFSTEEVKEEPRHNT